MGCLSFSCKWEFGSRLFLSFIHSDEGVRRVRESREEARQALMASANRREVDFLAFFFAETKRQII